MLINDRRNPFYSLEIEISPAKNTKPRLRGVENPNHDGGSIPHRGDFAGLVAENSFSGYPKNRDGIAVLISEFPSFGGMRNNMDHLKIRLKPRFQIAPE